LSANPELEMDRLVELLKQLAVFLARYSRAHWVSWIERDIHLLENYDPEGIEHFLSAFGGMGSLNDVYFSPQNGDAIESGDIEEQNGTFQSLLSECWQLARDLHDEKGEKVEGHPEV
jgi:hypothetical protein